MTGIRRMVGLAAWIMVSAVLVGRPAAGAVGANVPIEPVDWQSAGDSYSSGEGVFGNVGDSAQSDLAYGPQAASFLRSIGWQFGSETFTACTGHLVEDYFNPRTDSGGKDSLWEWGRQQGGPERVDIIAMSFGGNDIGFADLIVDCLPVPESWSEFLPTGCDPSQEEIEARVDALLDPPVTDCVGTRRSGDAGYDCDLDIGERRGSIIDFYFDVVSERLTDHGRLYIVGYPRLFAPVGEWRAWSKAACQGITRGDAEKLGLIAEHLNDKLREAVQRANQALGAKRVVYLDRLTLYRDGKHELCGSGEDWLNGIAVDRGDGLGIRQETSFHPNEAGHDATAGRLVELVAKTYTGPDAEVIDRCDPSVIGADIGVEVEVKDGLCLDGFAYVDQCYGGECGEGDSEAIVADVDGVWRPYTYFPAFELCRDVVVRAGVPLPIVDRVVWACDNSDGQSGLALAQIVEIDPAGGTVVLQRWLEPHWSSYVDYFLGPVGEPVEYPLAPFLRISRQIPPDVDDIQAFADVTNALDEPELASVDLVDGQVALLGPYVGSGDGEGIDWEYCKQLDEEEAQLGELGDCRP